MRYVSAATYIFCKDSEDVWNVLVGKRSGNSYEHQGGYYNVPVGMAEYGEDALTCARRECYEETGLNIPSNLFRLVGKDEWRPNTFGANFLVVLNGKTTDHETGEGDWENEKFEWIPINDIRRLNFAYGMGNTIISIYKQFVESSNINENKLDKTIKHVVREMIALHTKQYKTIL